MHPFGGTPVCPRCNKLVYAAEQMMGPGRKLYHKPCLTCASCNKRLDSLSLVEHDDDPYCKQCHTRNFGTKDLRQANLPQAPRPTSPASPPRRTTLFHSHASGDATGVSEPSYSNVRSAEMEPSNGLKATSPDRTKSHNNAPLIAEWDDDDPQPSVAPSSLRKAVIGGALADVDKNKPELPSFFGRGRQWRTPTTSPAKSASPDRFKARTSTQSTVPSIPEWDDEDTSTTTPLSSRPRVADQTSASANKSASDNPNIFGRGGQWRTPAASPVKTPLSGLNTPSPLKANNTGGWTPRLMPGTSTPLCPKCGKSVYFAEQVQASGRTWHRPCLRCAECNTSLDSMKLAENEGRVVCKSCYSKLYGPQGSGYALLGKAGG